MNAIAFNWQTTLAGVGTLITVAIKAWQAGWQIGPDDIMAVMVAFGLIAAKDGNKTGVP